MHTGAGSRIAAAVSKRESSNGGGMESDGRIVRRAQDERIANIRGRGLLARCANLDRLGRLPDTLLPTEKPVAALPGSSPEAAGP